MYMSYTFNPYAAQPQHYQPPNPYVAPPYQNQPQQQYQNQPQQQYQNQQQDQQVEHTQPEEVFPVIDNRHLVPVETPKINQYRYEYEESDLDSMSYVSDY